MTNNEAIVKGQFRMKVVEAGRTLSALNDQLDAQGIPAESVLSVRFQPARSWSIQRCRPSFRVIYRQ